MLVLVVEDDDDSRELVATVVKAAGHTVIEAADGETAIDQFQGSTCSIVILDWMLPGLSGVDVARKIKTIRYAYILMVTGLEKKEHAEEALGAGVNDYVQKPFDMDELIECVGVAEAIVTARERVIKRFERLGVNVDLIGSFL